MVILLIHIFAFSQTEHKIYHENGNLKQVGQFDENGKCTGWKYYDYNGELEKVGKFINQQQIGDWFFYIEGYLYNIATYKNGIIQTDKCYHKNGKKQENGYHHIYPLVKVI